MASHQSNHSLPPPPGQSQNIGYQQSPTKPQQHSQPQSSNQQTRAVEHSRGLSYQSQKSSGSNKNHLNETHNEKEARRLHSKADPTQAMNEAEPAAVAAQAKNTMGSLRSMQHKDNNGHVITDPDQSNPTRWRFERPLDTIRAHEANIERSYRTSVVNAGDNESVISGWNRRSSYYANGTSNGRYQHHSYYESQGSRPQSAAFRSDIMSNYGGPQQRHNRMNPGPQYGQRGPVSYAGPSDRSHDTIASGSGTSGERPGYVTDPSSDNSSFERRQSPPKRLPEPMNDYGIGFGQNQEYQTSNFTVATGAGDGGGGGASAIPRKDASMLRKPVIQPQVQPTEEKRKSWFRRISKA